MYKLSSLWLVLLMAISPAQANDSAQQQLQAFVQQVSAASGSFSQSQQAANGAQAQRGSFAFERPGKFRWQVEHPFEQLIVSDGSFVYQFDPDLDQVSKRSASQAIGASPAAILFGAGQLEAAFVIEDLPASADMQWLRATPRSPDAGFSYVDIGFAQGLPRALKLLDAFGQVSNIKLADIVTNQAIDPQQFNFVVPDGVDLVQMN